METISRAQGGNNMKKNLANFLHLTSLSQGEAMAESILQNASKIGVLEGKVKTLQLVVITAAATTALVVGLNGKTTISVENGKAEKEEKEKEKKEDPKKEEEEKTAQTSEKEGVN